MKKYSSIILIRLFLISFCFFFLTHTHASVAEEESNDISCRVLSSFDSK